MCSLRSFAAARASRRNRWTAAGSLAACSCSTFSATRCSSCMCIATATVPMPPAPRIRSIRNFPATVAPGCSTAESLLLVEQVDHQITLGRAARAGRAAHPAEVRGELAALVAAKECHRIDLVAVLEVLDLASEYLGCPRRRRRRHVLLLHRTAQRGELLARHVEQELLERGRLVGAHAVAAEA